MRANVRPRCSRIRHIRLPEMILTALLPGGAGKAVLVCDGEPALGGLTEVGANFVDRLSLRVAARKCKNRGGIAADLRLRADNGGEIH